MNHKLRTNPIYTRLTRKTGWPSARLSFWLMLALAIVSLLVGLLALRHAVDATTTNIDRMLSLDVFPLLPDQIEADIATGSLLGLLLTGLLILAGLVTILGPAGTALLAGVITGRDAQDRTHTLVTGLTPLTGADLVGGYRAAVLFKSRAWLIFSAGLLPLPVLGMIAIRYIETVLTFATLRFAGFQIVICQPQMARVCIHRESLDLTWQSLTFLALALGLWGLNWLAAEIGIGLALWLRRIGPAVIGALLVVAAYLVLAWKLYTNPLVEMWIPPALPAAARVMLAPYLLALAVTWASRQLH